VPTPETSKSHHQVDSARKMVSVTISYSRCLNLTPTLAVSYISLKLSHSHSHFYSHSRIGATSHISLSHSLPHSVATGAIQINPLTAHQDLFLNRDAKSVSAQGNTTLPLIVSVRGSLSVSLCMFVRVCGSHCLSLNTRHSIMSSRNIKSTAVGFCRSPGYATQCRWHRSQK